MNTQNPPSEESIAVNISGHLVFSRAVLRELLQPSSAAALPAPAAGKLEKLDEQGKPPRLAYTMRETAEMLGVSYITVHRLLQRGLLRSSLATRTKIIPRKEIERFLDSTTPE